MTDLHIHSTHSDGTMTPAEILALAEEKGLTYISITDHNKIGAYTDLKDPAVRSLYSGAVIPGTELCALLDGQVIDILGYGIDTEQIDGFIQREYYERKRPTELDMLYDTYVERGVHFRRPKSDYSPEKDVSPKRFIYFQLIDECNRSFWLDPAHRESWTTYYRRELYNPVSPLYVDYSVFFADPNQVVDAIHQAGGKAFLAHCYLYTEVIWGNLKGVVDRLHLDGIECFYPSFTPEQRAALVNFCKENGLLISGGSDFHGKNRPHISMGCEPLDAETLFCLRNLKTL